MTSPTKPWCRVTLGVLKPDVGYLVVVCGRSAKSCSPPPPAAPREHFSCSRTPPPPAPRCAACGGWRPCNSWRHLRRSALFLEGKIGLFTIRGWYLMYLILRGTKLTLSGLLQFPSILRGAGLKKSNLPAGTWPTQMASLASHHVTAGSHTAAMRNFWCHIFVAKSKNRAAEQSQHQRSEKAKWLHFASSCLARSFPGCLPHERQSFHLGMQTCAKFFCVLNNPCYAAYPTYGICLSVFVVNLSVVVGLGMLGVKDN